ncbi:MAG: hypothetical protein LUF91_02635 [Oscillospiraceae bacterium]|nr:hypothetical protein [Oscillospiraceae bacterium]
MTDYDERINALFEELVPPSGKADTVAGEIIRAVTRIGYRNYNDGDHIGVGYGRQTCNPAARFLMATCGGDVRLAVLDAWGVRDDDLYDAAVTNIEKAVLAYLDRRPELKSVINNVDMFDCTDPQEDRDDYEDEEEDWI